MIDFFSQEPFEVVKDEMGEICYTQSGKPIFKPIKYPTMDMFAKSLGVNRDTIFEWASVHKEFGKAKENAIELAKNIVIQNGLIGAYNSTFCIFMCKANFGMRDGGELDQAVPQPLEVSFNTKDCTKK